MHFGKLKGVLLISKGVLAEGVGASSLVMQKYFNWKGGSTSSNYTDNTNETKLAVSSKTHFRKFLNIVINF